MAGGDSGIVDVWYPMLRAPIGDPLIGHDDRVTAVAAGRIGERDCVVSASLDGTVQMWDALHGTAIGGPLQDGDDEVLSVAVGQVPGREVVICGRSDGTLRLWQPTSNRISRSRSLGAAVTAVAVGQLQGRDATSPAATGRMIGQRLLGLHTTWRRQLDVPTAGSLGPGRCSLGPGAGRSRRDDPRRGPSVR